MQHSWSVKGNAHSHVAAARLWFIPEWPYTNTVESHLDKPCQILDREKRYCLVDTMVLLQIYRRNPRLASMVDAVRDGRELLLILDVLDECFNVFQKHKPDTASAESIYVGDESGDIYELFDPPVTREDFRIEPRSRDEFDGLLLEYLQIRGIGFVAAQPGPDEIDAATAIYSEKRYRNRKGVPLSRIDCILLHLAIENQNVDVITDDAALAAAVLAECGPGRASHALSYYFGRLNTTANFLARILDMDFIDCNPIRDRIEYRIADSRAGKADAPPSRKLGPCSKPRRDPSLFCAAQVSPDGISVESGPASHDLKRGDMGDIMLALSTFVQMVVVDWYCACGDVGWAKFDKEWTDVKYDYDTMRITSKTNMPYYGIAKSVLRRNRRRYCACSRPEERSLHEVFKAIASNDYD